jgi:outer membrane protein OmpA-like peptidoglycan-associated protein
LDGDIDMTIMSPSGTIVTLSTDNRRSPSQMKFHRHLSGGTTLRSKSQLSLLTLATAVMAPALSVRVAGAQTAPAAQAAGASASVGALALSSDASTSTEAPPSDSASGGYIERYPRQDNVVELGAFIGPLLVADENSFRGLVNAPGGGRTNGPFSTFEQPLLELGVRAAYFPLRFLGAEIEGFVAPGKTLQTGNSATILAGRVHLIAQSPMWSVTPFVVAGAGYWQVINDRSGDDTDPAFHFGGGAKFALSRHFGLRIDLRDSISNRKVNRDYPHNLEALAGAQFELGSKDAPLDSDGDSILDDKDSCPSQSGLPPSGCPSLDKDGDGILDADDRCADQAGQPPTGCPVIDADGDGVNDAQDQCANTAGLAPTGCPDADRDGVLDQDDQCPSAAGVAPDGCRADPDDDGVLGADDRCPDRPETMNGFEDADGCPDELPQAVQSFTGVMAGIEFDMGKQSIRSGSQELLDQAVKVLQQYPSLRIEIVGHTDDTGDHTYNVGLSERRAESVRKYLLGQGIEASRIEAKGAGPDQPLVPNSVAGGRQRNRRIELHLLQ